MARLDDGSWMFEPGMLEEMMAFAMDDVAVSDTAVELGVISLRYEIEGYKARMIEELGMEEFAKTWGERREKLKSVDDWDGMRCNVYLKSHTLFDLNRSIDQRRLYCKGKILLDFLREDVQEP